MCCRLGALSGCQAVIGDSLASNVKAVSDLLTALDEVGERIDPEAPSLHDMPRVTNKEI